MVFSLNIGLQSHVISSLNISNIFYTVALKNEQAQN